jgi:DNA polymerase III epsilon subunit-like protein
MNLFVIDTETSGLDPQKCEILEIGAVNYNTGETFEVKVHPLHIKDAEPRALEVNGYNEKDWEEAFLLPNALKLLSQFIGGEAYMAAFNVSFDRAFLEKAYKDCNLPYPFHYHHLDVMSIAWSKGGWIVVPSLKQVCTHFGIEPEPAIHSALNGAQCAYQILKKLI